MSKAKKIREYHYTEDVRRIQDTEDQGIGTVEVSTLKLAKEMSVQRATYSYTGRVLISSLEDEQTVIFSMQDDGTDRVELYRGEMSSKYRLFPFADNTRVFLGKLDLLFAYVLEK